MINHATRGFAPPKKKEKMEKATKKERERKIIKKKAIIVYIRSYKIVKHTESFHPVLAARVFVQSPPFHGLCSKTDHKWKHGNG